MLNNAYSLAGMLPDKPLRLMEPKLYGLLVKELERLHLHPYDVKASARCDERGFTILLRFGDDLGKLSSRTFSLEDLEAGDGQVAEFFRETANTMQRTLIADYYKMMKSEY
ncbi:hypothetical protein [Paenibacillus sp. DYY-L-2]|uniref:hypothetical protein n=1 Tax=Paenibacillus sp. DYY-L-2 TaxID=3447013 RepID=UPI003F505CCC